MGIEPRHVVDHSEIDLARLVWERLGASSSFPCQLTPPAVLPESGSRYIVGLVLPGDKPGLSAIRVPSDREGTNWWPVDQAVRCVAG